MAINAVIAWRLPVLPLLGWDTPELPAQKLFCDIEIQVLEDYAQERGLQPPENLGRGVLALAGMGGT